MITAFELKFFFLFFLHKFLANKKHIGNIFCCYLDQEPSGGGRGVTTPLAETLPPSCPPNEITFCTGVYGEPPFWVPVSPPLTPPCCPLILKSLAMPLQEPVTEQSAINQSKYRVGRYSYFVMRFVGDINLAQDLPSCGTRSISQKWADCAHPL